MNIKIIENKDGYFYRTSEKTWVSGETLSDLLIKLGKKLK